MKKKYYKTIQNIKNILINIFYVIMSLIFFSILLSSFFNNKAIPASINPFLMIFSCCLLCTLMYLIARILKKIKNEKFFVTIAFLLLIIIQIGFAYLFAVTPSWDFGTVYESAISEAIGDAPINSNLYFYFHSNNIGIAVLLKTYYQFFNLFGISSWNTLGILLNIFLIDLAVLYIYKTCKMFFSKEQCNIFLLITITITPFITYVPIYYTDTLSMPFTIMGIYYFFKYKEENNRKLLLLILSGLFLGLGACIKSTAIIVFVAIIIFTIFQEKKVSLKRSFQQISIISIGVILMLGGLKLYINLNYDQKQLDKLAFPSSHYVMMGLKRYGGYDAYDQEFTGKFEGKKNKQEANKKIIKKRLNKMLTNHKLLSFYLNKATFTWGDGTFFATYKLSRFPVKNAKIKDYILFTNSNKNMLYQIISKAQILIMLFFLAIGMLLKKYLSINQRNLLLLTNVSIFGLFLLLLVWETRSRYIVNFVPLMLISTFLGISALSEFIKVRKGVKYVKKNKKQKNN